MIAAFWHRPDKWIDSRHRWHAYDQLERELGAKQAEIDRLMLEYCPEEMTPAQMAEWERHQKAVVGAEGE